MTKEYVLCELALIEENQGVGPDGDKARCEETGQPFVTIAWGHKGSCIKPEGQPCVHSPTPEAAWALWFAAFESYIRIRRGKVYWRKRPVIMECFTGAETAETIDEERVHTGYLVWARVFVDG